MDIPRIADARGTRAARRLTVRHGRIVGAWYWSIYLLLAIGIVGIAAATGNDLTVGVFDITTGSSRWAAIGLGAGLMGTALAAHVAAGGTRRSLWRGVVAGALVVGVAFGVVTVLVMLAERGVAALTAMTWRRLGALPIGVDGPEFALTVVPEALVIATYTLVGAAISVGYYRWRAWRGTLALFPLLIPAALVDVVTGTGVLGALLTSGDIVDLYGRLGLSDPVLVVTGIGAASVTTAFAAVVLRLMLRNASLRAL